MDPIRKIRKWLEERKLDGVILSRRDNYSWVTKGRRNQVLQNEEVGIASLVIKQNSIDLIADSIDAARIFEEETGLDVNKIMYPWYENKNEFYKKYVGNKNIVSDTGIARTMNVQDQLIDLRLVLSDEELQAYRKVGLECATVVEKICMESKSGQTEQEIAYNLKSLCLKNHINPDCVLVGSDERILKYRHPMPTMKKVDKSLMVVLGGEKYGLNISMTRIVYFGTIPEETLIKYKKTQRIFAEMQMMMKDGLYYQDFFENVKALYKEAGYEGEWKLHHQGGPTAYGCREFIVTPDCKRFMRENQAYAWNPTITGTKCEETTFLSQKGVETFTRTDDWPCSVVSTDNGEYLVADIMKRNI